VYRYSATLSSTSALYSGGWSTPRSGRFTCEKVTPYHHTGDWVSLGQVKENLAFTGVLIPDRPARDAGINQYD
jgi:hypothetical protein